MPLEKETYRSGAFKDFMAQGTRVGNVLYLSGQVGMDAEGKAGADITEQTKLAYQNIRDVLAEFGATMDNVVDETWFVTDVADVMANATTVFGARAEAYGGVPEVCQTLIGVSALVMPDLMLEVKCVAHLD